MDTLAQPLVGSQHPDQVCFFFSFCIHYFEFNFIMEYAFLCHWSNKVIFYSIFFRISRSCLQVRQRWRLFMAQCMELYSQDTGRQTDWQHIIRRQWLPLPLPHWTNKFRELKSVHNLKCILWLMVSKTSFREDAITTSLPPWGCSMSNKIILTVFFFYGQNCFN